MTEIKLRSTADIAKMTGIPVATWRYWRHINYGPQSVKIGRRVYYREELVLEWFDRQFGGVAGIEGAA